MSDYDAMEINNGFKREGRYIVIKLKDLNDNTKGGLQALLIKNQIPVRDAVVVESDWPNYEQTWRDIEAVSRGEFSDHPSRSGVNTDDVVRGLVDKVILAIDGGERIDKTMIKSIAFDVLTSKR